MRRRVRPRQANDDEQHLHEQQRDTEGGGGDVRLQQQRSGDRQSDREL